MGRGLRITVVLALAAAALAAAGWWFLRQPHPQPRDTGARLQAVLTRLVRNDPAVHNVTLAVARGDGSFAWAGAAGPAGTPGGPPMTADTPIYIASVTKLYTATVVLMLAERGRLSLDDPMARHLPTALVRGLNTYAGQDGSAGITIRQLLSHRSGIADYYRQAGKDGRTVESLVQDDPGRAWSVDEVLARTRSELAPHGRPGEETFYSDANFQLLGKIVESVTGQSLEKVCEELLFRPLGLTRTHLASGAGGTPPDPGIAHVFRGDTDVTASRANPVYWADGGLASTPREALAFLRALRTGRLVGARSLAAMHQWHPWRFPLAYGLGTMEFRLPAPIARLAGLPPLWGHSGSTGSFLYDSEERDLYLAGTLDQTGHPREPFLLMREALRVLATTRGRRRHLRSLPADGRRSARR